MKALMVLWLSLCLLVNSIVVSADAVDTEEVNANESSIAASTETAQNTDLALTSKSTILMESSTGKVILEQNADEVLRPASITKIMTLILIFDALDAGKIKLDDAVTVSAHAKSMGGSQVFLEEGEQQTVETLIKCIVIASGNDASVAMAEYISGSEAEFVSQMNERAKGLSMTSTNFEDCCGLTDSEGHHTSARDVAVMSRELVTKYPQIHNYSTIWMENITHVTAKGSKEFTLANTNKLLKQYEYTTGLKTGSTSLAKYCVSATASKDGINLIAVVMAAPDYKVRFSEAVSLFNYGFANCKLYKDEDMQKIKPVKVEGGVKDDLSCEYSSQFSYLSTEGENLEGITKEMILEDSIKAPVKKGQTVGKLIYKLNEKEIGSVDILAEESIDQAGFVDYLKKVLVEILV